MGAIHLSEVRCSGQEPSLWKCPHKNITAEDCSHSQDAGVRCNLPYTGVETKVSFLSSSVQGSCILSSPGHDVQPDSFPAHCPRPPPSGSSHPVPPLASPYVPLNHPSATRLLQKLTQNFHSVSLQIRLSGGRSRHEGRVEVQIGGPGSLRWGLICGDDWGTLEAMVACRQLGLGYANHGLQVSGGRETKAFASKACVWGRGLWK